MTPEEQIANMTKAINQAIKVMSDRFGSTESDVDRAIQALKDSMKAPTQEPAKAAAKEPAKAPTQEPPRAATNEPAKVATKEPLKAETKEPPKPPAKTAK